MKNADDHAGAVVRWMGALADPTRLRLLALMERQELGVAELCRVVQMPQSSVSRHLKVLTDLGWLRSRPNGTAHLYRLAADDIEPSARRLWALARDETRSLATARADRARLEHLLRARPSRSQAFFASAAARWDSVRVQLYGQGFACAAWPALLPRTAVVADLGCGTGRTCAELAPFAASVIGVDNSAAMLRAAARNTRALTNVDLRRGDVTAAPIDARSCDAAIMLLVLTYVPDPPAALREMARILKPGGRAVIVDLLPHGREEFRVRMGQVHGGFDPAELTTMMSAEGLHDVVCQTLAPGEGARGPALFLAAGCAR